MDVDEFDEVLRRPGDLPEPLDAKLAAARILDAWKQDVYEADWQAAFERMRERDPERAWSILAELLKLVPEDTYESERCEGLAFGEGPRGPADWAASNLKPLTPTTAKQGESWRRECSLPSKRLSSCESGV